MGAISGQNTQFLTSSLPLHTALVTVSPTHSTWCSFYALEALSDINVWTFSQNILHMILRKKVVLAHSEQHSFSLSLTHTHTNPEIGVFFVCLTKCITYKIRCLDATFSRCSSAAPLQLNAKGENDFLRSTVVRIICLIVHHKLVVHKVKAVRLRLIRVMDHFTHYGGKNSVTY